MKTIVRLIVLIGFFINVHEITGQTKEKYKLQLTDNDGNPVEFFLLGDKETLLKSNSDGILYLTNYQVNKYKNEKFTLHFSNHLAYLVYRIDLYNHKGVKTSDKHLKYNQLTIDKLTPSLDNVFYLRRKEIRLNEESSGEINE